MAGFGLLELRKLYIGELFAYYKSLIHLQEKQGIVEQGSSSRLSGTEDTVSDLRKQLFKTKLK